MILYLKQKNLMKPSSCIFNKFLELNQVILNILLRKRVEYDEEVDASKSPYRKVSDSGSPGKWISCPCKFLYNTCTMYLHKFLGY